MPHFFFMKYYATLFASLLLKVTGDMCCVFPAHVFCNEFREVAGIFMFGIQGQNTLSPQCGSHINTLELTCWNLFVFSLRTNRHFVLFYFKHESLRIRQV